jgi:hypothetical protein
MSKKQFYTTALISGLMALYADTLWLWIIVLMTTYVGLGTILAFVIDILTAGYGKDLALKIAQMRGMTDCGCSRRQAYLDKWTKIKLIDEIKL